MGKVYLHISKFRYFFSHNSFDNFGVLIRCASLPCSNSLHLVLIFRSAFNNRFVRDSSLFGGHTFNFRSRRKW